MDEIEAALERGAGLNQSLLRRRWRLKALLPN